VNCLFSVGTCFFFFFYFVICLLLHSYSVYYAKVFDWCYFNKKKHLKLDFSFCATFSFPCVSNFFLNCIFTFISFFIWITGYATHRSLHCGRVLAGCTFVPQWMVCIIPSTHPSTLFIAHCFKLFVNIIMSRLLFLDLLDSFEYLYKIKGVIKYG